MSGMVLAAIEREWSKEGENGELANFPAALAEGCQCPPMENHDGRGWIEACHSPDGTFHPPVYIFLADCLVHDPQETK